MFRDAQTSLALSLARSGAATTVATNTYDQGAPYSGGTANAAVVDSSIGEPLAVVVTLGAAATVVNGNETYEWDIVTATASDGTTGQKIIAKYAFTNAQAAALLKLGAVLVLPIPPGLVDQRFIGLVDVLGGTNPSVTYSAWIASMDMVQNQKFFASAIVIN